jgi:hypothetical protein
LNLKDATHLSANIAVPATIRLVAQTREQLLAAAEAFAPEQAPPEVSKNDFRAQYKAAQARATTDEYNRVRNEYPRSKGS